MKDTAVAFQLQQIHAVDKTVHGDGDGFSSFVDLREDSLSYHIIYSGDAAVICARQADVEETGCRIRINGHRGAEILNARQVG